MLDSQRIPAELLQRSARRDVSYRMAIGTLEGFALITSESGGEKYAMHPLVQASVHYWLEQRNEKVDFTGQALQLLAKEFPDGEYEHKETCESMLAHVQKVLCYDSSSEPDLVNRATLLYKLAYFNSWQGRYFSAYREISEAYDIHREQLGEFTTVTLDSLSLLALVSNYQGMYVAAEKMHRRALEGYKRVLGVENSDTLTSLNNLALTLGYQGKYKEAEKMHRRALEG